MLLYEEFDNYSRADYFMSNELIESGIDRKVHAASLKWSELYWCVPG